MSIFKISVENPVLVNMIMIIVIVIGTYSLITLPREQVPEIDFKWAFIITVYPGASPEEIEKQVTIPLEDEIQDVDKIDILSSSSAENYSFVWVKFEQMDQDEFDKLYQDLRGELDKVTDLPENCEKPTMERFTTGQWIPLANIVFSGDAPEKDMKFWAEELEDKISQVRYMGKTTISGIRDREIWVEINPTRMAGYRIPLMQVVSALQAANLNLPGGDLEIDRSEYLIRTVGEFGSLEDIGNVILRSQKFGSHVKISDIAKVRDTFSKINRISRFNSRRAVTITAFKKTEGNTIELVEKIKQITAEYRKKLPKGVYLDVTADSSIAIKQILSVLQNNAFLGLFLVIFILYLFMGWRNALFAAIGIPVTLMATFMFMKFTGRSLNGNSLFGLVLVLGMLVDDAVVIIENVFRYIEKGMPIRQAVLKGAPEVAIPVFSSILTTVVAFSPLIFMPGIMGEFFKIVPIVVVLALGASLFQAYFILPSHINEWSRPAKPNGRVNRIVNKTVKKYQRILKIFLRKRVLISFVILPLIFLLSLGMIPLVGVDLYSGDEISLFFIRLKMPVGTRLEETDRVLKKIETMVLELPKEELESVVTQVGMLQLDDDEIHNTHVGQIVVDLVEAKERSRSSREIIAQLREQTKDISGIASLEYAKVSLGPPTGKPVEVKVKGKYIDELEKVAELVKDELKRMPGVFDVGDDFELGKREMRLVLDKDRTAIFGLDNAQVATAVRFAFEGEKATVFHDGDEDVDVRIKFPEEQANFDNLLNLNLINMQGQLIPLKNVGKINVAQGFSEINRFERERAITVMADVDKKITTPAKVSQELKNRFEKNIAPRYPGYSLDFRGELEEFKKSFNSLGKLAFIGILLIFLILGTQFKSWVQPVVIMAAVPFSIIGAILGLLISNNPFSISTLYGIVALMGVAVNSSIVLMDFINKNRARGYGRWKAILSAGKVRLRPIMLTSITTIFGLLPMALGIGGKSLTWQPLALTIVFGLAVSSMLTLFIVPCLYAVSVDVAEKFNIARFRENGRRKNE